MGQIAKIKGCRVVISISGTIEQPLFAPLQLIHTFNRQHQKKLIVHK